ncbi:HNH/ENDO VII family nuclease [Bacillus sp. R86525]
MVIRHSTIINDKELYKQYNNFRNNYWKMRAQERLEGK